MGYVPMLSFSAIFGVMMAPAVAVLMTSLIVRLFENHSSKDGLTERSLFRSGLAERLTESKIS